MREEIHLEDGKYTVVLDQTNGFDFFVERNNERWKDLVGDKFTLAFFQEVRRLKEQIQSIDLLNKIVPTNKIELASDKEFHVAYWKTKGMLSGINVRAAHMEEAMERATEKGINRCLIVYAIAIDAVFPVL